MVFLVGEWLSVALMIVRNQCWIESSIWGRWGVLLSFHSVEYKYIPGTLRIHRMGTGQESEYTIETCSVLTPVD